MSLAVGLLTLELRIEHAHSLKEKRHVVRSLVEKIRARFNVSCAEVDYQDLWQNALIAVAVVSASKQVAAGILAAVEAEASNLVGPMLVEAEIEWL
jgi:uncharacterized protein YlxP (DUF503 family)